MIDCSIVLLMILFRMLIERGSCTVAGLGFPVKILIFMMMKAWTNRNNPILASNERMRAHLAPSATSSKDERSLKKILLRQSHDLVRSTSR